MTTRISSLYVDDDGYVCFDQIFPESPFDVYWTLHHYGWEAFIGDAILFRGEITYPTPEDFKYVEKILSYFRLASSGMVEIAWMEDGHRKHLLFDTFEGALEKYNELESAGKLE